MGGRILKAGPARVWTPIPIRIPRAPQSREPSPRDPSPSCHAPMPVLRTAPSSQLSLSSRGFLGEALAGPEPKLDAPELASEDACNTLVKPDQIGPPACKSADRAPEAVWPPREALHGHEAPNVALLYPVSPQTKTTKLGPLPAPSRYYREPLSCKRNTAPS